MMAEYLRTSGVTHKLEEIILGARKHLILISPYLSITPLFQRRLSDVARNGVQVTLVYGKADLQPDVRAWIDEVGSIDLRYCQDLHAKCYVNDNAALITSMNLYAFSQSNNEEMGIYVTDSDDPKLFRDILNDSIRIVKISQSESESRLYQRSYQKNSNKETENIPNYGKSRGNRKQGSEYGHCIRCSKSIDLDPLSPYCRECYRVWKRWEDIDYPENVCHICNQEEDTSMAKPACYACYLDSRNILSFPNYS